MHIIEHVSMLLKLDRRIFDAWVRFGLILRLQMTCGGFFWSLPVCSLFSSFSPTFLAFFFNISWFNPPLPSPFTLSLLFCPSCCSCCLRLAPAACFTFPKNKTGTSAPAAPNSRATTLCEPSISPPRFAAPVALVAPSLLSSEEILPKGRPWRAKERAEVKEKERERRRTTKQGEQRKK